jgi:hypothetical protein
MVCFKNYSGTRVETPRRSTRSIGQPLIGWVPRAHSLWMQWPSAKIWTARSFTSSPVCLHPVVLRHIEHFTFTTGKYSQCGLTNTGSRIRGFSTAVLKSAQCCDRLVDIYASYSGSTGFKFRSGDQLSKLRFSVAVLTSSGQCRDSALI